MILRKRPERDNRQVFFDSTKACKLALLKKSPLLSAQSNQTTRDLIEKVNATHLYHELYVWGMSKALKL